MLARGLSELRMPCLGADNNNDSDIVAMDAVSHSNRNVTVDSDATVFMHKALSHKPVTYRTKVNRRSKVKGQLKGLGRQIRELGANKLNLHTLAVL